MSQSNLLMPAVTKNESEIIPAWSIELSEIELNRIQSNSIVDWVRLIPAIERNRTPNFVWVRFPNQSNLIGQIEPNRTQSIGLCSIEFGYRIQLNTVQWIAFDWVRFVRICPIPSHVMWSDCPLSYCTQAVVNLHRGERNLYKASPSKTRFSRPLLMIIQ